MPFAPIPKKKVIQAQSRHGQHPLQPLPTGLDKVKVSPISTTLRNINSSEGHHRSDSTGAAFKLAWH